MIDEAKLGDYEKMENSLFFGGYQGNYYLIMIFEDLFEYELFETYMGNASWNMDKKIRWTTDYENYKGRSL